MPEALAKEIRLKEREVFAYLANNSRPRPAWFLRMGARIIGTKTRSIL